jgi:hypothetical protein
MWGIKVWANSIEGLRVLRSLQQRKLPDLSCVDSCFQVELVSRMQKHSGECKDIACVQLAHCMRELKGGE